MKREEVRPRAWCEGMQAAFSGLPQDGCPYEDEDLSALWRGGFEQCNGTKSDYEAIAEPQLTCSACAWAMKAERSGSKGAWCRHHKVLRPPGTIMQLYTPACPLFEPSKHPICAEPDKDISPLDPEEGETPPIEDMSAPQAEGVGGRYLVKEGDTLWRICEKTLIGMGFSSSAREIQVAVKGVAEANNIANPDLILIGKRLDLSSVKGK